MRTRRVLEATDAIRAEVMTIRERLRLTKDLGIKAVILEGDAKIILENFESSLVILSHNGLILADAYRLAYRFSYFKAQLVPRTYNIIVDKLA